MFSVSENRELGPRKFENEGEQIIRGRALPGGLRCVETGCESIRFLDIVRPAGREGEWRSFRRARRTARVVLPILLVRST